MASNAFSALMFSLLALPARGVIVPSGTAVFVRLLTQATSESPSGQPIRAVVTASVFLNGRTAIPARAIVTGNTEDAAPARSSSDAGGEQPAKLKLSFTHIDDGHGNSKQLASLLINVDNAREPVDSAGLITGIETSQTLASRIDQGIGKLQNDDPGLARILSSVRSSLLRKVDPSITYPPGTDLTIVLTQPLDWNPASAEPVRDIGHTRALARLVNGEPFRTRAENPPAPSDLTNIMLIGTSGQIERAFEDAGWSSSAHRDRLSSFETARAIIEDRGYKEAPVSRLTLDGRPPDLVFEKQTNTFAKRHHIRIWQRPGGFDGEPVWVAAATHDIGIGFSAPARTFSHAIDSNIDLERSKVVDDLVFTKLVRGLSMLPRSGIPADLSNATGDTLQTDGRMAVLEF